MSGLPCEIGLKFPGLPFGIPILSPAVMRAVKPFQQTERNNPHMRNRAIHLLSFVCMWGSPLKNYSRSFEMNRSTGYSIPSLTQEGLGNPLRSIYSFITCPIPSEKFQRGPPKSSDTSNISEGGKKNL
jgi:hypothetical protein